MTKAVARKLVHREHEISRAPRVQAVRSCCARDDTADLMKIFNVEDDHLHARRWRGQRNVERTGGSLEVAIRRACCVTTSLPDVRVAAVCFVEHVGWELVDIVRTQQPPTG